MIRALVFFLSWSVFAEDDCTRPDLVTRTRCSLRVYPTVSELSGSVITAIEGQEYLWTLGDGGQGTVLGRSHLQNKVTQAVTLKGLNIENLDWESMSYDSQSGLIWILDGGTNNAKRNPILAYGFKPSATETNINVTTKVQITYPSDQMVPDIEASIIVNSNLYLIEKTFLGDTRLFKVQLDAQQTKQDALALGLLDVSNPDGYLNFITDATITGENVTFLSYTGLYQCPLNSFLEKNCTDSLVKVESFDTTADTGNRIQWENLTTDQNGVLWLGREDGRVFRWNKTFLK